MNNNDNNNKKCKMCSELVTRFIKSKKDWWDWCSNKCMGSDPATLEKKRQTNRKKFGVDHPMELDSIRDKIAETNISRYGTASAMSSKVVQDRLKQVMLDKYGTDNASKNPEIIEKIRQKAVHRFEHHKDEVLAKRRETNYEKFGASSNSNAHLSKYAREKIHDLKWLKDQHFNLKKSCQQIADELGCSFGPILRIFHDSNITPNRYASSGVEQDLCNYIESVYSGNVIKSDRSVLTPKELDIYLPDANLAFELNGVYWHGEARGKDKNYHLNKTEGCETKNIHLLQIYDSEWLDPVKRKVIESKILHLLGKSNSFFARDCVIKNIDSHLAIRFLNENHIQGSISADMYIAAFFNNTIMGVSSYKITSECVTLVQYASKIGVVMPDMLSESFKIPSLQQYNNIVYYADRRYYTVADDFLTNNNFTIRDIVVPNYKYFNITNNTADLYPRDQFQKHLLEEKLKVYDANLSEYENMKANNYDRIWDCGSIVYEWKRTKDN